jgi:hypothetical protein
MPVAASIVVRHLDKITLIVWEREMAIYIEAEKPWLSLGIRMMYVL